MQIQKLSCIFLSKTLVTYKDRFTQKKIMARMNSEIQVKKTFLRLLTHQLCGCHLETVGSGPFQVVSVHNHINHIKTQVIVSFQSAGISHHAK